MAVNTNKRIPVKWIRDKAKAAYVKQANCYICSSQTDLELHHLNSITHLLEVWSRKHNIDIGSDEAILAVRDRFISEHHVEIYDLVYTLCNRHHVQLHGIYGKSPSPSSVTKQQNWIELQRKKLIGGGDTFRGSSYGNYFAEFTGDLYGVTKDK